MINYKNTPGWDEKAHELTNDRGVDCVVEVGVVMIGLASFGVTGLAGPATPERIWRVINRV